MKGRICLLVLLLVSCCLSAQEIEFKQDVYNFGKLREEGKAVAPFVLKNTGDAPLIIRRVTVSCGCTTYDYPQTPIAPGDTAVIKLAYNTEGRPGNFNKNVTVYSNALSKPAYTLTIRGTVEGRDNTATSLYPKEIGPIRLRTNHLFLGEVTLGSLRTETIAIYNQNEEASVKISFQSVPKHLRVSVSNSLLEAGETAIITVNYMAGEIKDYGSREDFFFLTAESETGYKSSGKISVSCHLKEDFSKMKHASKKPEASYSFSVIDLGEVEQGQVAEAEVVLTNTGSDDLHIRKISSPSTALQLQSPRQVIRPGKSVNLKVTLDTSKLKFFVKYYLDIITNDPVHPLYRITVSATVKE